jgi:hypothetical protein
VIDEILSRYEDACFEWGRLDCCLFVADVLLLLTGRDYAAPWRGTYDSEFGAKRLVIKYGGLGGLAAEAFGDIRLPEEARDGDPVLFTGKFIERDSIGGALGIAHGGQIVYLTQRGLDRAPLTAAVGCWNV